jgi:hypothetical protein
MFKSIRYKGMPLLLLSLLSVSLACSALAASRITVQVPVDPITGHTVEQNNIANRLRQDTKPGAILHLYVISPESGQALIYSTVKGKVTSSGKRLTPRSTVEKYVTGSGKNETTVYEGQRVVIQGGEYITTEILQDDGTYGNSVPYFYWFDANGRYHQHFFTEGQVLHISAQPLAQTSVVLNVSQ